MPHTYLHYEPTMVTQGESRNFPGGWKKCSQKMYILTACPWQICHHFSRENYLIKGVLCCVIYRSTPFILLWMVVLDHSSLLECGIGSNFTEGNCTSEEGLQFLSNWTFPALFPLFMKSMNQNIWRFIFYIIEQID